jgi:hypothetical protein
MQVSGEKAVSAFLKVKRLKEHWGTLLIAGDRETVSIEDYQYVIEDMYGLRIEKREVIFDGEHLRGMVERYRDNRARVLIWGGQPDRWKRFTAVKELTHLVIDEEEDWSVEGATTLDRLIYEIRVQNGDLTANFAIQSEILAMIAAIEILYPYAWRLDDAARRAAGEVTTEKLALEYNLPAAVVFRALHPEHLHTCERLWNEVRAVEAAAGA